MRIFNLSLCLIFLLTFQSCNILNKDFSNKAKINFDYNNKMIFVPVEIQGKEYNFLFDTGSYSVISNDVIEEIKEKKLISNENSLKDAAGQDKDLKRFNIDDIKIGNNLNLTEAPFLVSDLSSLSQNMCVKVDGVIGSNIMQAFAKWKIDYLNNEIIVTSDKEEGENGNWIPIEIDGNGIVRFNVKTEEGLNVTASLDTGNNSSISISNDELGKSGLKNSIVYKGIGINQTTYFDSEPDTTYFGKLNSLKIGNDRVKDVDYDITNVHKNLIGNAFLERFGAIIIDYHSHRLLLNNEFSKLEVDNTFGFTPYFYNGYVIISQINEQSEADKKGLYIGDTIYSINNKKVYNISNEKWCEMRREMKNSKKITLKKVDDSDYKVYDIKEYNPYNEH